MLLPKTIHYQGNEYIVTHEFEGNQIWAFRELGFDLIEVYRKIFGIEIVNTVVAPIMGQILTSREYLRIKAEQEQLNYESVEVIKEGTSCLSDKSKISLKPIRLRHDWRAMHGMDREPPGVSTSSENKEACP